jgi:hypothetical protein
MTPTYLIASSMSCLQRLAGIDIEVAIAGKEHVKVIEEIDNNLIIQTVISIFYVS